MNGPPLTCKEDRRREDVRQRDLYGLDYVEVSEDQTRIYVYFLKRAPQGLDKTNLVIEGGRRIRDVAVQDIDIRLAEEPEIDDCVTLFLNKPGDHSIYSLRLVGLENIDPRYDRVDFSFKVSCPSTLDCKKETPCPPPERPHPEISYLAKDYASFRQLILDRLALIMPDWKERHVPDLGIALVEVLAYVGDHLSYYQDAVATEAYLGTCRQRISARRHVRLVDYLMHEGSNSRAWVCLETEIDLPGDDEEGLDPQDIYFATGYNDALPVKGHTLKHEDLQLVPSRKYEIFEPMLNEPVKLYQAHNQINFYTWGDVECCLPLGATTATLEDQWVEVGQEEEQDTSTPQVRQSAAKGSSKIVQESEKMVVLPPRRRKLNLKLGDVLIFEEVIGPRTGNRDDADPNHRHAVRLIKVNAALDELYDRPILNIEWAAEDALPFPLCISALVGPECKLLKDISVARGNVLLVDHGRTALEPIDELDTISWTESWTVPWPEKQDSGCEGEGMPLDPLLKYKAFTPQLTSSPLTHSVPFPKRSLVASQQSVLLAGLMERVLEQVRVLLAKVGQGELLSGDEVEQVVRIFGHRAAMETGLIPRPHHKVSSQSSQDQYGSLKKLLDLQEVYLAKKHRRLKILSARAGSGYVMGQAELMELQEMFGPNFGPVHELESTYLLVPASHSLHQDPRETLPWIRLYENRWASRQDEIIEWTAVRDLLNSGPLDRNFVAEVDNFGRAHLRFGDGCKGRRPMPENRFQARFRVGNGTAGNVGAEAISIIVFRKALRPEISRVRNPLPAIGGVNPEPMEDIKLLAPATFRKRLMRAITAQDYADLLERDFREELQRATAGMRWTGSWYEVKVAIDPWDKEEADEALLAKTAGRLHRYRRIGHDLAVRPAIYVPLELELMVCVKPHHLRGHVEADLRDLLSNRKLPDGRLGFFHPDNLTFGEGVNLSKIVSLAQSVAGVESVQVTKLNRLLERPNHEIENGVLPLGHQEVARLDNDPSFPENGILVLDMRGGL